MRKRIYLSSSITNGPLNLRVRRHLPPERYTVVLPQEFAPLDKEHPDYPRSIYEQCIAEMARCDAAILLLDAFGIDCASEAGWLCASGKPLIGLVEANLRFLRHWMVKGNLSGLVCFHPAVAEAIDRDPILDAVPRVRCKGWSGLEAALDVLLDFPRDDEILETCDANQPEA